MKQNNTKGFSIVLALGLALLLSYTWLYLLDYMVPFSRNIKWIENATKALYESYGGVEDALYAISVNNTGYEVTGVTSQGYEYDVDGIWQSIPAVWLGTSDFDANWNKLSQWDPIQLKVGQDRLNGWWPDRIRISLRIPDFDGNGSRDNLKTSDGDDDIILWQLSSSTDSISTRDGEFISESDINWDIDPAESLWNSWVSSHGEWVMVDGTDRTFQWFYNNNSSPCDNVANECVLKISIINPLISSSNDATIPYLEYQVLTDRDIPLRYAQVNADGTSFWYTKNIQVAVPQQTTNSAFDFTVFQ